VNIAVVLCSYE